MNSQGTLRIGTSGYQYDHWKGVFYPDDLPKKRWFEHYAQSFDTVEINNTFYNLPAEKTFDSWRDEAPESFLYALKFSRFGTHIKKLKDPEDPIERFLERAGKLGSSLGPILVQLPGKWKANPERLAGFLEQAPSEYRWTVELRDESWFNDEVYAVLEQNNAALCLHDMVEDHPERLTADWTYLRYHGEHYAGSYSDDYLAGQADRIRGFLADGHDVYAYFNNDEAGHAVHNALDLRRLVEEGG